MNVRKLIVDAAVCMLLFIAIGTLVYGAAVLLNILFPLIEIMYL